MHDVPTTLEVSLNGTPIGVLARLPGNLTVLTFRESYVRDSARPILSLGFLDTYNRIRTAKPAMNGEIPAFFANLLPENDLRRYVANRAGISTNDDFGLLWVTGGDLPGAATVEDSEGRPLPPPGEGGPEEPPPAQRLLRFSLAGVQLKFSAVNNPYGGLTIRAQGREGHYIVKLPSRHLTGVPENEFAMLRFAKLVGIEVPPTRLVPLEEIEGLPEEAGNLHGSALAIERFDRTGANGRIHIEDFNQIFRQQPKAKYDNFAFSHMCATIYRVIGNEALIDFINRLVFNIAIANSDMHLKNWSVIYRDGKTPQLSPAYDYVCTKVYLNSNDTGLAIASARDFPHVTFEQFERMAKRAGVSARIVCRTAHEMVERLRSVWRAEREDAPGPVAAVIDEQFRTVPLLSGTSPISVGVTLVGKHDEIA